MTIAVTGATGNLGRLIISELTSRVPAGGIVALVRSPERGADLGVAVRAFDYSRPETLGPGLEGVDALMLVSSSEVGNRFEQHRAVIAAARAAGVERIVYTSLLHADVSTLDLAEEHRQTEQELRASGIEYTILRNGWYAENYLASVDGALARGVLVGSAGDGLISAATRGDLAEAAAVVLTNPGHGGRIYELAGDEPWTLSDLAAEIALQTGRAVSFRNLSGPAYAETLESAGLPRPLTEAIAGWDVEASRGALHHSGRELSSLIGRPTTPLAVSVAHVLAR